MSATTNVVRISEVDECISRTLEGIRLGVLAARKSGLDAQMPDEVAIDMVIIKDWQVLEVVSKETGTNSESQGGGTTETTTENETRTGKEVGKRVEDSKTTDNDTKTGTETSSSLANNEHVGRKTTKTDS